MNHSAATDDGAPVPGSPPTCDILSITTCLDIADSVGSAKPTVSCWINRSDKTSTRACHGFNSRERQTVVMAQSTSESSSRLLQSIVFTRWEHSPFRVLILLLRSCTAHSVGVSSSLSNFFAHSVVFSFCAAVSDYMCTLLTTPGWLVLLVYD